MAGRPRKYKTIKELQEAIDIYFVENKEALTISGLALALDFVSRQSIYDAAERDDEFSYIIKKAVFRIENFWEKHLLKPNYSGAIFWLKNRGWTDKTEHSIEGSNIHIHLKDG